VAGSNQFFIRRRPELLALEGWYDVVGLGGPTHGQIIYRFKFSCRYKDILRCSTFLDKPRHFMSCFGKGGGHDEQPYLRCLNPNWAIVYTPDIHGNFMGRAFVHLEENNERKRLIVDKIYGNRLDYDDLRRILIMKNIIDDCLFSGTDTYLSRELG